MTWNGGTEPRRESCMVPMLSRAQESVHRGVLRGYRWPTARCAGGRAGSRRLTPLRGDPACAPPRATVWPSWSWEGSEPCPPGCSDAWAASPSRSMATCSTPRCRWRCACSTRCLRATSPNSPWRRPDGRSTARPTSSASGCPSTASKSSASRAPPARSRRAATGTPTPRTRSAPWPTSTGAAGCSADSTRRTPSAASSRTTCPSRSSRWTTAWHPSIPSPPGSRTPSQRTGGSGSSPRWAAPWRSQGTAPAATSRR